MASLYGVILLRPLSRIPSDARVSVHTVTAVGTYMSLGSYFMLHFPHLSLTAILYNTFHVSLNFTVLISFSFSSLLLLSYCSPRLSQTVSQTHHAFSPIKRTSGIPGFKGLQAGCFDSTEFSIGITG